MLVGILVALLAGVWAAIAHVWAWQRKLTFLERYAIGASGCCGAISLGAFGLWEQEIALEMATLVWGVFLTAGAVTWACYKARGLGSPPSAQAELPNDDDTLRRISDQLGE